MRRDTVSLCHIVFLARVIAQAALAINFKVVNTDIESDRSVEV